MSDAARRRSERVFLDVEVVVRGESTDKQPFQEETFTLVVNAHGALIFLFTKVALGQRLLLMNPRNWDEREARVVYLDSRSGGLSRVGIAFQQPAPDFWPISECPSDWNALPV